MEVLELLVNSGFACFALSFLRGLSALRNFPVKLLGLAVSGIGNTVQGFRFAQQLTGLLRGLLRLSQDFFNIEIFSCHQSTFARSTNS